MLNRTLLALLAVCPLMIGCGKKVSQPAHRMDSTTSIEDSDYHWITFDDSSSGIHILLPEGYHEGEVDSSDIGLPWIALIQTSDSTSLLRPVDVVFSRVVDELLSTEDSLSAWDVKPKSKDSILFLLSGTDIKNGEYYGRSFVNVPLSFDSIRKNRFNVWIEHFVLLGIRYEVVTRFMDTMIISVDSDRFNKTVYVDSQQAIRHLTIDLMRVSSSGEEHQMLVNQENGDIDGLPRLLWAGDVDGDGKLDVILDVTNNYDLSLPALYLSSRAKGTGLVHEVAHRSSVGC